jgi:hypothetical protein
VWNSRALNGEAQRPEAKRTGLHKAATCGVCYRKKRGNIRWTWLDLVPIKCATVGEIPVGWRNSWIPVGNQIQESRLNYCWFPTGLPGCWAEHVILNAWPMVTDDVVVMHGIGRGAHGRDELKADFRKGFEAFSIVQGVTSAATVVRGQRAFDIPEVDSRLTLHLGRESSFSKRCRGFCKL